MALIYPDPLPEYVRRDPFRHDECRVYDILKSELDESFRVYYSRPWLGTGRFGEEIDGESDFVVAHPDLGICVLEVKGGLIAFDAIKEKWTSTDSRGIVYTIKNPFAQARSGKYHIIKKLTEHPNFRQGFVPVSYGVIFPDSQEPREPSAFGIGTPIELIAFGAHLPWLADWLVSRMKSSTGEPLGKDRMDVLHELLAKSFELRPSLAAIFKANDVQVKVLTGQQYLFLEMISRHKRSHLQGGAGTGKTLLALEKSKRLTAAGKKTLYCCFNRPLSEQYASLSAKDPLLTVSTFHQLCMVILKEVDSAALDDLKKKEKKSVFFDKALPDLLLKKSSEIAAYRYDSIVIDEGQDFLPEWWDVVFQLLRSPQSELYVFSDDNQKLKLEHSGVPTTVHECPFDLTRNLRNTNQIFTASKKWYEGSTTLPSGIEGADVRIESSPDLLSSLECEVKRLCVEKDVPPSEVAILLSDSLYRRHGLGDIREIAGFPVVSVTNKKDGCLVFESVSRFKGLESSAVIYICRSLSGSDNAQENYVAVTRARSYLSILVENGVV